MDAISYTSQVITILFFIGQFALYTFPAEEVAFEFLDVPNTIYISKWYKNKVEIQKLMLYVMMKSQQQQYFTGAGLIDINVETFDSPVILSNAMLPLDGYAPESDIMFAIVASSQFYCLWLALAVVTAYDFVYVACCIHVILQLRLLKQKIKDALDKYNEDPKQRLCYYIKHHQFLYSNIEAISYVSQIITIVFIVTQFALYTFPAEEVAFEFLDIPNTIYTSKWYKNKVAIQKLVLYVMMKSQQQQYFTGAGPIDINVETFDSLTSSSIINKANMDVLLEDEILYMGLNLMIFIGERMQCKSKALVMYRICNSSVVIVLLVFAMANFTQAELGMYVRNVQAVVTLFHLLFKYTLFIYWKCELEHILISTEKFWNYKHFDEETIKTTTKVYKIINVIQISAVTTSLVGLVLYFLKPAFNQNDVFIIDAWIFVESIFVDVIVLACQYYCLLVITPIIVGYDTIYLSLCTHVVLQVRFLKQKLKQIFKRHDEDTNTEIHNCIAHHQLLVSIFSRMQRVYSLTLLFHYFVTLLTGCSDLYELLTTKADISYMIVMIISLMFIYTQFGYYAVPADIVASEISDLSNSIYMSEWYKNSVGVQKQLLFMMVRSQRQQYFMGAGMIEINIYAYGSVIEIIRAEKCSIALFFITDS
ncbi:7tm Odorant receptor [Popillia japonica]|uniref:7tm Odorant receptor n=1 Tax=Popillia japonica TaxID=7064 RepID=A0AAW1MFF8_POPJA